MNWFEFLQNFAMHVRTYRIVNPILLEFLRSRLQADRNGMWLQAPSLALKCHQNHLPEVWQRREYHVLNYCQRLNCRVQIDCKLL